MSQSKIQVRLTLTDAVGRVGTTMLGTLDPMVWTGDVIDDGGETVEAVFEQVENGNVTDRYVIDGDSWCIIDSEFDVEDVLMYVRAGVTLESAVDAVLIGCDPDGYDADYEKSIEIRDERIAALEDALAAAVAHVETFTGNGCRVQPPEWAVLPNGDFDTEEIAKRGRALLSGVQS